VGNRAHEKAIFEAFLRAAPEFAGEEIAEWEQPADKNVFPDVICRSTSGRRVGVELGEWLNEAEIQAAKSMEGIQASILAAVGEQGQNTTENIHLVWLLPKPKVRIKPSDVGHFQHQLFECIRECDRRWPAEGCWHSPQGHLVSGDELSVYPALARHVYGVQLFPSERHDGWPPSGRMVKRRWPVGHNWITFPVRGGSYSEETMLQPLLDLLSEKKEHYGAAGLGFDHLSLVVYYHQALLYNSPVETDGFTFDEPVAAAAQVLGDDPDPFHNIYLFVAVDSGRVLRVCQRARR